MSSQVIEKITNRFLWLFTPKEVKDVYHGFAEAMKEAAIKEISNQRPKELNEIESWELIRCPKFTYGIKKYTVSNFILPYGNIALLFRGDKLIALTYAKCKFIEEVEANL